MEILIKKVNNIVYIDKKNAHNFTNLNMDKEPYNFTKIYIDDVYRDCESEDFDENLKFNIEKYNLRKEKESILNSIQDLKNKLLSSDYKAIKYAEGLISEEDYAPIKAERENYRKAINSLEISLK